jgi:hypothetical protein
MNRRRNEAIGWTVVWAMWALIVVLGLASLSLVLMARACESAGGTWDLSAPMDCRVEVIP